MCQKVFNVEELFAIAGLVSHKILNTYKNRQATLFCIHRLFVILPILKNSIWEKLLYLNQIFLGLIQM